jgi:dihydrofolate reductase
MARIVVSEFITLDGVMEDPGGAESFEHGGWSFQFDRGEDGNKFKVDELLAADALLLGRVTYQGFAKAWPNMHNEFADKMNSMRKYVVSTSLSEDAATWNNTTVIRSDVVAELTRLKAAPGGDLLVAGSARLVQSLVQNGLVDEYRLMVYPIVLGTGKRLFTEATPTRLALDEARSTGDGIMMLTYHPAAAMPAASTASAPAGLEVAQ